MTDQEFEDSYFLRQEQDAEILMHRDVHFGGNFGVMLSYYRENHKGIRRDFEIRRIEELAEEELRREQNLSPLLLGAAEIEKIAKAKQAYQKLADLYEQKKDQNAHVLLIADLILSEEEDPQAEIAAIVKEKSAIVPSLLELLRSEEFADSLFPGYGLAPALAAKCLGEIGDKRALIALFEEIGKASFQNEDILLQALKNIGPSAKEFLLTVVRGRPVNADNANAALALLSFKEDREVGACCLALLEDPSFRGDLALATYLVLACESITDPVLQKKFHLLSQDAKTSSSLRRDMEAVSRSWR